jgi:hypothetical protein
LKKEKKEEEMYKILQHLDVSTLLKFNVNIASDHNIYLSNLSRRKNKETDFTVALCLCLFYLLHTREKIKNSMHLD